MTSNLGVVVITTIRYMLRGSGTLPLSSMLNRSMEGLSYKIHPPQLSSLSLTQKLKNFVTRQSRLWPRRRCSRQQ